MKANLSTRDYEQISAYLDGQLSIGERNRLEARLRTQPDLQVALDEMSRTRALLRQAPKRRAPRNFTLTPEMVAGISPRRRSVGLFNGSLFPALSFTSALATLALMISLAARLLPGPAMSTMASPMASAPMNSMEGATIAADSLQMKSGGENEFSPENPAANAAPAAGAAGAPAVGAPAPEGSTGAAADNSTAAKGGEAAGNGQGAPSSDAGALLGPQVPADTSRGLAAGGFGGMGGGGGGPQQGGGQIVVPQEGIASLDSAASDAAAPNAATAAPTANPATRNVQITGSGPILGVPSADTAGQVIEQRSVNSQPASPASDPSTDGTITAEPAEPGANLSDETVAPSPVEPAESGQRSLFGLSMLAVTQILLGAIALATGAAAWILYRKTRG
jgi:anti-sigma factor RsiW